MSLVLSIKEKLNELRELNKTAKLNLNLINEKRDSNDVQHQVLFISLVRVIKYFDAYLLLAENGFGEPAAVLLRSIYEALLWMRWSIIKKENAQKYFDGSKGEALRMVEKLYNKGFIQLTNITNQEKAKLLIKNELKSYKLPSWNELAMESGLDDLHVLIYPMLSAMSHGSMLFMGERIIEEKTVSPDADQNNIEPFINIANNLLRDCILVCEQWVINGKLHPVPDIKKLMLSIF